MAIVDQAARARMLGFARKMRQQPTAAESAMWTMLRAGRLSGFKFKRQQPIGMYIVDFVCLDRRFIVEIDGGQHGETQDRVRSEWLTAQGFAIRRFWNNDVLQNPEGVFEAISRALRDNPSPQPLSRKGRGAKAKAGGRARSESESHGQRESPCESQSQGEVKAEAKDE